MIKKITLEGFNDLGGAKYEDWKLKYFKKTKNNKKASNKLCILAISRRILDENPPYFACADFFTFSIDLEWSQGLGSLKMKV